MKLVHSTLAILASASMGLAAPVNGPMNGNAQMMGADGSMMTDTNMRTKGSNMMMEKAKMMNGDATFRRANTPMMGGHAAKMNNDNGAMTHDSSGMENADEHMAGLPMKMKVNNPVVEIDVMKRAKAQTMGANLGGNLGVISVGPPGEDEPSIGVDVLTGPPEALMKGNADFLENDMPMKGQTGVVTDMAAAKAKRTGTHMMGSTEDMKMEMDTPMMKEDSMAKRMSSEMTDANGGMMMKEGAKSKHVDAHMMGDSNDMMMHAKEARMMDDAINMDVKAKDMAQPDSMMNMDMDMPMMNEHAMAKRVDSPMMDKGADMMMNMDAPMMMKEDAKAKYVDTQMMGNTEDMMMNMDTPMMKEDAKAKRADEHMMGGSEGMMMKVNAEAMEAEECV